MVGKQYSCGARVVAADWQDNLSVLRLPPGKAQGAHGSGVSSDRAAATHQEAEESKRNA